MSKSPPRVALNTGATSSSGVEAEEITDIPLDELNDRQQHSATAQQQNTQKVDIKGKGKARVEEQNIVDDPGNYDLQAELEEDEAVRLHQLQQQARHGHENVFDDENGIYTSGDVSPGNGEYPPMGDDDLEERRVNETLKRWEEAERQRRKAVRESNRTSGSPRPSLVGDVSRRASKLWKEGAQRRTSLRRGAARIRDDESPTRRSSTGTRTSGVTREDGLAPSRSTTLSTQERERDNARSVSPSSPTPLVSNNPFSTPRMGSPVSLEDRYDASRSKSPAGAGPEDALMQGTSAPPTPSANRTVHDPEYPDRPILQASGSGSYGADALSAKPKSKRGSLPPPRPLDLPEEFVPSPTTAAATMPRAVSPMVIGRSDAEIAEDDELEAREASQGRWWTDWLCGCREGGRLGQDQAGRTNPFE